MQETECDVRLYLTVYRQVRLALPRLIRYPVGAMILEYFAAVADHLKAPDEISPRQAPVLLALQYRTRRSFGGMDCPRRTGT